MAVAVKRLEANVGDRVEIDGRVQVSFDADVWSQEVERLRARGPMRAAGR